MLIYDTYNLWVSSLRRENPIKYPDFINGLYISVYFIRALPVPQNNRKCNDMLFGSSAVISRPFVISLNCHVCLQSPTALFAVLAWEGHSHAGVPQTLSAGSSEFPAFVSTPVGCASMQAFVCWVARTSSPVTLSLSLFLSVWYLSRWTPRPTRPADGAMTSLQTYSRAPFCPPCSLTSCSYPGLLIQRWTGSGAGGRSAPTGSAGACRAVWSQGLRAYRCVLPLPVSLPT